MTAASEAASEATRARNHARMVARVEELLWLIEVYGYTPAEARRQLRLSALTFGEYQEYAASHPELRAAAVAAYSPGPDSGPPAGQDAEREEDSGRELCPS